MSIPRFLVGLGAGWLCGWIFAHKTVAQECEERGWFFVGRKTFRCVEITTTRPSKLDTVEREDRAPE